MSTENKVANLEVHKQWTQTDIYWRRLQTSVFTLSIILLHHHNEQPSNIMARAAVNLQPLVCVMRRYFISGQDYVPAEKLSTWIQCIVHATCYRAIYIGLHISRIRKLNCPCFSQRLMNKICSYESSSIQFQPHLHLGNHFFSYLWQLQLHVKWIRIKIVTSRRDSQFSLEMIFLHPLLMKKRRYLQSWIARNSTFTKTTTMPSIVSSTANK